MFNPQIQGHMYWCRHSNLFTPIQIMNVHSAFTDLLDSYSWTDRRVYLRIYSFKQIKKHQREQWLNKLIYLLYGTLCSSLNNELYLYVVDVTDFSLYNVEIFKNRYTYNIHKGGIFIYIIEGYHI